MLGEVLEDILPKVDEVMAQRYEQVAARLDASADEIRELLRPVRIATDPTLLAGSPLGDSTDVLITAGQRQLAGVATALEEQADALRAEAEVRRRGPAV